MKNRIEERGLGIEGRGSRIGDAGVRRAASLGRSSKGFTLIELIVVISIIVILTGALLTRIWFYQEQAEKAAMEQVAGALQSAMVLQFGRMLVHGREDEAKNLLTENPIRWLMRAPPNYAGEFDGVKPAKVEPGNWAFDLQTRELIYLPDRSDYFVPGKDGLKWVRYRARLEYENAPDDAKKGVEEISGVLFEPVERYQWFVKEEN